MEKKKRETASTSFEREKQRLPLKQLSEDDRLWDIIVIGAGPAGLTAGANCAQRGLSTLVLEAQKIAGGQPMNFYPHKTILDHPGFPRGIKGDTLSARLYKQAKKSGAEIHLYEPVVDLKIGSDIKKVITAEGIYRCKRMILCTGLNCVPRKLVQMEHYSGRHLHYHMDADISYRKKRMVVVGGGDTSFENALEIKKKCLSVTLISRENMWKAKKTLVRKASEQGINLFLNHRLVDIDDANKTAVVQDQKRKRRIKLPADEVFAFVGYIPTLGLYKNKGLRITQNDHIYADQSTMETTVPGVFAAGDIASDVRLIAVACSQGILAAIHTFEDITQPYWLTRKRRRKRKKA
jgi:thioredoxin reductase (NADPH)